jgi:hypothetical protein
MIETLLQSMGVKPEDFQEVISVAKSLDARLTAIEDGQRQILQGLRIVNGTLLQIAPRGHPYSPTCATGGKP